MIQHQHHSCEDHQEGSECAQFTPDCALCDLYHNQASTVRAPFIYTINLNLVSFQPCFTENLNKTSKHLGSFTIDLNKPVFQAGIWADHVGSWEIDRQNTASTDPFTILNARASVNLPFVQGLSVGGTVFNLLDEEFFSYTEFDFSSNPIGASPGRPRWFLLTANYRF